LPLGHTGYIDDAIYSPNGNCIVTIAGDNTAKIWDAKTGLLFHTLEGHTGAVRTAVFSPDGKRIVTTAWDLIPRVWDVRSGTLLSSLKGHSIGVNFATFSPDSKLIVTASSDHTAKIWDANTGSLVRVLEMNDWNFVQSAVFSPGGKQIVTISENKIARIWDAQTGQLLFIIKSDHSGNKYYDALQNSVWSALFSPDGKRIITIFKDKTARIWDALTGGLLYTLDSHNDFISFINLSSDGKQLVTAAHDGTIKIWDTQNGLLQRTILANFDSSLSTSNEKAIKSARFSADGKYIVTASGDKTAKVWDVKTGKSISMMKDHSINYLSASFSPDGKQITTANGGNANIWDAQTGMLVYRLDGHAELLLSTTYSSDGKSLVTTSVGNKTARVWDLQTGIITNTLNGHTSNVIYASYSADGKLIVTGSWDETARIWDAKTGKMLFILKGHTGQLFSAKFSFDGKYVVTSSGDSTARIWDAQNGNLLQTFRGHPSFIYSASFSPDRNYVVTAPWGLNDYTARIWDVKTGNLIQLLEGHTSWLYYATFSPDGKQVVTASMDSTAKMWDVKTGKMLITLKGHMRGLSYATYYPDGKRILTASDDNTVKIWDAKLGSLLESISLGSNIVFGHVNFESNQFIASNKAEAKVFSLNPPITHQYSLYAIDSSNYLVQLPAGYYQTTSSSARLLHYVSKDLKIITFEQLDVKYNRPDKVLEAIGNTDTGLIKSYRKAYEKRIKKLGIDTASFRDGYSVPEADFINRDNISTEQKNEKITLHIKGIDSAYKLDRFNVWVNEVPVFGLKGISIRSKNSNSFDSTFVIKLSQGENRIETSITNVNGTESYRIPLLVKYTPAIPVSEKLHFIGIGINEFANSNYNLRWSVKDIRDLALRFKAKYAASIIIDTLFDEKVTIDNIKALNTKLQQLDVNDKVVLAYSGHGLLSKDYDYYLSTHTVNFDKPEQNGLPYEELENLLDNIKPRKKLMLVDACHSGEVDKEEGLRIQQASTDDPNLKFSKGGKLSGSATPPTGQLGMKNSFELMQELFARVGRGTGTTVISAAAGTQFAYERGDLKNGVFTFSLLDAFNQHSTLTISELKKIVSEQVSALTKGLQKPTFRSETQQNNWVLW
jgi:WD40 repeat protein